MRLEIPNRWFCDCRVGGAWVAVPPRDQDTLPILTAWGTVILPGENVQYVRLARDGRFSGNGHYSGRALERVGLQWVTHGASFGPNAVIYDRHDALQIQTGPPPYGYRYVDANNQIVRCSDTYADPVAHLYEWTDFGDVKIGQGESGVHVLFADEAPKHRLLEDGDTVFVRADRVGDDFAIAFHEQQRVAAVFHWLTLAELRALPEVPATAPAPPVVVPTLPPFSHPVHVAPFDDSGIAPCTVKLDDLGYYTEIGKTRPNAPRVLLAWDNPYPPQVPAWLQPQDLYLLECYRVVGETVQQSRDRWSYNLGCVLALWRQGDIGIISQLYGQGGAPPNERWTVPEVLDVQAEYVTLVNRSTRVVLLAPFKFDRANGVTAHPEYRAVLDQFVQNARAAGAPVLWPLPSPVPSPPAPPAESIDMVFFSDPLPGFHLGADVVPVPNDTEKVAVQATDGRYLKVDDLGNIGYDATITAWNKFRRVGNALVAEDRNGKNFVLQLVAK